MGKLSKQDKYAIDFALFCTGYHYVRNDDFEEGYCWQNAPEHLNPKGNEPLLKYSSETLMAEYKQQLKYGQRNHPHSNGDNK